MGNWYISLTASVILSIILDRKALRTMALFIFTSQIIPSTLVRESWRMDKFDFGSTITISKDSGWLSFIALCWIIHKHFFVSIAEIMVNGCTKFHARYIVLIFILAKLTYSFMHFLFIKLFIRWYSWWLQYLIISCILIIL